MNTPWPVIVLGGSGYVAGEFARLVAQHPRLTLGALVSTSQVGEPVAASFPHLAPTYPEQHFEALDNVLVRLDRAPHWIVLSAAPHGASAQIVDRLLSAAEQRSVQLTVVDASADFRFRDAAAFAEVYGHAHATPARLAQFTCAVPEQLQDIATPHVAHPGCFATAMLLGIMPLAAAGVTAGPFFVSATTGSTGSGRSPKETTHHPVRHSNMFAYQALKHRHVPEVRALMRQAIGTDIELHFVPHSGPFSRGIYSTIFAPLAQRCEPQALHQMLDDYYSGQPFVSVDEAPPRVKDVAGSNFARLHITCAGDAVVVVSTLDNLVKGAAGGSIQWVNRLLGLPETEGLMSPAPGWI